MNISIGARNYVEGLRANLHSQLALFSDGGFELAEETVGGFTFIDCNEESGLHCDTVNKRIFVHCIANVIADIILDRWEGELIERELKSNHQYFTEQERTELSEKVTKVLNNTTEEAAFTYKLNRKTRIAQKVREYLEYNEKLILEGFINFRLKEYQVEIQAAVAVAVEEFLVEKEYTEFIRLLRYFVDIQEPKVDTLHALSKGSGIYQLFDENLEPVSNDYLEGFTYDLVDNEIAYDDLLVSALITTAPRRVVLHLKNEQESDTIRTINNVFGDRVSCCLGCRLCNQTV